MLLRKFRNFDFAELIEKLPDNLLSTKTSIEEQLDHKTGILVQMNLSYIQFRELLKQDEQFQEYCVQVATKIDIPTFELLVRVNQDNLNLTYKLKELSEAVELSLFINTLAICFDEQCFRNVIDPDLKKYLFVITQILEIKRTKYISYRQVKEMVSLIIENAGNLRFTANVIGPLLSPNKQCILFEKVNKMPYTIQNLFQAPKTFPNQFKQFAFMLQRDQQLNIFDFQHPNVIRRLLNRTIKKFKIFCFKEFDDWIQPFEKIFTLAIVILEQKLDIIYPISSDEYELIVKVVINSLKPLDNRLIAEMFEIKQLFSKENILFGKIFKEKFVFDSPTDRLSLIDLITSKFGEKFYVFANTLSSLQDITQFCSYCDNFKLDINDISTYQLLYSEFVEQQKLICQFSSKKYPIIHIFMNLEDNVIDVENLKKLSIYKLNYSKEQKQILNIFILYFKDKIKLPLSLPDLLDVYEMINEQFIKSYDTKFTLDVINYLHQCYASQDIRKRLKPGLELLCKSIDQTLVSLLDQFLSISDLLQGNIQDLFILLLRLEKADNFKNLTEKLLGKPFEPIIILQILPLVDQDFQLLMKFINQFSYRNSFIETIMINIPYSQLQQLFYYKLDFSNGQIQLFGMYTFASLQWYHAQNEVMALCLTYSDVQKIISRFMADLSTFDNQIINQRFFVEQQQYCQKLLQKESFYQEDQIQLIALLFQDVKLTKNLILSIQKYFVNEIIMLCYQKLFNHHQVLLPFYQVSEHHNILLNLSIEIFNQTSDKKIVSPVTGLELQSLISIISEQFSHLYNENLIYLIGNSFEFVNQSSNLLQILFKTNTNNFDDLSNFVSILNHLTTLSNIEIQEMNCAVNMFESGDKLLVYADNCLKISINPQLFKCIIEDNLKIQEFIIKMNVVSQNICQFFDDFNYDIQNKMFMYINLQITKTSFQNIYATIFYNNQRYPKKKILLPLTSERCSDVLRLFNEINELSTSKSQEFFIDNEQYLQKYKLDLQQFSNKLVVIKQIESENKDIYLIIQKFDDTITPLLKHIILILVENKLFQNQLFVDQKLSNNMIALLNLMLFIQNTSQTKQMMKLPLVLDDVKILEQIYLQYIKPVQQGDILLIQDIYFFQKYQTYLSLIIDKYIVPQKIMDVIRMMLKIILQLGNQLPVFIQYIDECQPQVKFIDTYVKQLTGKTIKEQNQSIWPILRDDYNSILHNLPYFNKLSKFVDENFFGFPSFDNILIYQNIKVSAVQIKMIQSSFEIFNLQQKLPKDKIVLPMSSKDLQKLQDLSELFLGINDYYASDQFYKQHQRLILKLSNNQALMYNLEQKALLLLKIEFEINQQTNLLSNPNFKYNDMAMLCFKNVQVSESLFDLISVDRSIVALFTIAHKYVQQKLQLDVPLPLISKDIEQLIEVINDKFRCFSDTAVLQIVINSGLFEDSQSIVLLRNLFNLNIPSEGLSVMNKVDILSQLSEDLEDINKLASSQFSNESAAKLQICPGLPILCQNPDIELLVYHEMFDDKLLYLLERIFLISSSDNIKEKIQKIIFVYLQLIDQDFPKHISIYQEYEIIMNAKDFVESDYPLLLLVIENVRQVDKCKLFIFGDLDIPDEIVISYLKKNEMSFEICYMRYLVNRLTDKDFLCLQKDKNSKFIKTPEQIPNQVFNILKAEFGCDWKRIDPSTLKKQATIQKVIQDLPPPPKIEIKPKEEDSKDIPKKDEKIKKEEPKKEEPKKEEPKKEEKKPDPLKVEEKKSEPSKPAALPAKPAVSLPSGFPPIPGSGGLPPPPPGSGGLPPGLPPLPPPK